MMRRIREETPLSLLTNDNELFKSLVLEKAIFLVVDLFFENQLKVVTVNHSDWTC